jgi:hypothetical protein
VQPWVLGHFQKTVLSEGWSEWFVVADLVGIRLKLLSARGNVTATHGDIENMRKVVKSVRE